MLSRGTRWRRFAAPAVSAIHFAAATFVPVVHPYLHHHPASGTAAASPSVPAPGDDREAAGSLDVCPACLASPGITVLPGGAPEACPRISRPAITLASDQDLPARRAGPGNRVRAPPLS